MIWYVRNRPENLIEGVLNFGQLLFQGIEALAQVSHFGQQWRDVLARRLCLADPLGLGVALSLQCLRFDLHGFAALLGRTDSARVQFESADTEALRDRFEIGPDQFWVEHVWVPGTPA